VSDRAEIETNWQAVVARFVLFGSDGPELLICIKSIKSDQDNSILIAIDWLHAEQRWK
jgi:hypothetical protein